MRMWSLVIIAAVSVPLLSAAVAPRRWLKRSMALAFIFPVILYFGIIVWELLTRPPEAGALGLAFSGFGLVSAVLTIPWLVICLVGFGIGFAIRRILRGNRDQEAPLASAATAAQSVTSPESEIATDMAHWRSVHIGFAHDGLKIGDVDVWTYEWRAVAGSLLRLAHPAYPRQIHTYRLFEAGDEGKSTRFAASELSNGVWGFYVATSDMVSDLAEVVEEARAPNEALSLVSIRDKNAIHRAVIRSTPRARWRIGLLMLIGTFIAIAVAAHRVARYSPVPAQKLTPMPAMPDFESPPRQPIQP